MVTVFTFEVWVHPKEGGDDYCGELDVKTETLENAQKTVEQWLKRHSTTSDYKLLKAKGITRVNK